MRPYRVLLALGLLLSIGLGLSSPASADVGWMQSLGSYAKRSDTESERGILMLKPLDDGCVLFDLSVCPEETGDAYRLAGIFILDDQERGTWEGANGQTLSFSKYRQRIAVQANDSLPEVFNGAYFQCSTKINGTAPMLEQLIEFLPLFKTQLLPRETYAITDISDNISDYRKLTYTAPTGQTLIYWATPSLDCVMRIQGQQGVIIYQEQRKQ